MTRRNLNDIGSLHGKGNAPQPCGTKHPANVPVPGERGREDGWEKSREGGREGQREGSREGGIVELLWSCQKENSTSNRVITNLRSY